MTTLVQTAAPTTADDVLAAVARLAPAIAERASEIEEARRLSADLLGDLVAAGCFRTLLPASHGGVGADLASTMRVVEALSRADGSVGWTVMIGSATWVDLAALPRRVFDGLYADGLYTDGLYTDGPDVMIAGAFSPSGVAVPVDGGYRVTGRWAFASGSSHADWFYGNCMEQGGDQPRLRIALFGLDDVEVEDTWHVLGLRGTASNHFAVDNVVVPAERTHAVMEDEPSLDSPAVRIPPPALFSMLVASCAVGIARGALDDIGAVAATKVPLLAGAPLAASPTFQRDLALAETRFDATAGLLHQWADRAWGTAADGGGFTWDQRARIRAAAAATVTAAVDVVSFAYRAGGSAALYLDSPLQRRFRDVNTLAQHFLVRPDTFTTAGAVLAGQEIELPVF